MRTQFLVGAKADLRELRRYILQPFGDVAWRESYKKIQDSISRLQTAPESGSIPDELADLHLDQYRQVISGLNRIIYEIKEDAFYIHLVCDSRRDLRTLLQRRLVRPQ